MELPDYAIEAREVVKVFPATKTTAAKTALDGVDLMIPRGSIFGLLGPNGAGKSTFINILAGLCRKSSGTVKIWGLDIDTSPRDARAAIGVVPQEVTVDVFFTPRESLEVQAGYYGVVLQRCRIGPHGLLEGCKAIEESPKGLGFGAAAEKASGTARVSDKTEDGAKSEGLTIEMVVVANPSCDDESVRDRARDGCLPPHVFQPFPLNGEYRF